MLASLIYCCSKRSVSADVIEMLFRLYCSFCTGYVGLLYKLYWSVVNASLKCCTCSVNLLYNEHASLICCAGLLICCVRFINLFYRLCWSVLICWLYWPVVQAFWVCCTGFDLLCHLYWSVVHALLTCFTGFINLLHRFYWSVAQALLICCTGFINPLYQWNTIF